MAETTVVIPNWNGRRLLGRCLDALQAQTYQDFDIILVDNGSTDGSVAYLREHFPEVRVIVNEENRGFAAATNQGIRAAGGPRASRFIATLNNDTEAAPRWLAALVAAMETEPQVGMCASAMFFAHRPEMINSAGIAVDRAGIAWDRLGGAPLAALGDAPEEVFGPCAGAALYRRAMLEEIGLFDEDFFAYMEDVDLAWRARAAGWRCLFAPQARVLHHHSATGKEGSPFKSFHLGRNKVWLLLKNYPARELWHHAPLALFYDLAAVLYALLVRRDLHALRGRLAGWRDAPRMWRQRPRRDPDRAADLDLLAPLVWPWRVSRRYRHIP
ncbi:MAG: glycosyltransferase family 2 protein [Anaerolineales bacterium]